MNEVESSGNSKNKQNESLYSTPLIEITQIENVDYLIDPFFPAGCLCAVVGSSDTGKSTLIRQLLINIGNGSKEFIGLILNQKSNNCIYVATEDDAENVRMLMTKQAINLNESDMFLSNIHIITETSNIILKLENDLSKKSFDAIIIDTHADIFEGDGNSNSAVRTFLAPYATLAKKYKCCIIFIYHTGKGKEKQDASKNNIIGSQAFEAKMRVVIEIKHDNKDSRKRQLCITKGNYISQEEKCKSYDLNFNNLIFESTGERKPIESKKEVSKDSNAKDIQIAEMLRQDQSYTTIQNALGVWPGRISAVKKRIEIKTSTTTVLPSQNCSSKGPFN